MKKSTVMTALIFFILGSAMVVSAQMRSMKDEGKHSMMMDSGMMGNMNMMKSMKQEKEK